MISKLPLLRLSNSNIQSKKYDNHFPEASGDNNNAGRYSNFRNSNSTLSSLGFDGYGYGLPTSTSTYPNEHKIGDEWMYDTRNSSFSSNSSNSIGGREDHAGRDETSNKGIVPKQTNAEESKNGIVKSGHVMTMRDGKVVELSKKV